MEKGYCFLQMKVKDKIVTRFLASIRDHALVLRGQHILLGISGGADSMMMMHLLSDLASMLNLQLTVAYLDHDLRDESAEDGLFVKNAAKALGLSFVTDKAVVQDLSEKNGISLEMAAREARYDFFARMAKQTECDAVATAHTLDDLAETVLLKMARGAGMGELSGISRETELYGVRVIRPILDLTRKDVEDYLNKRKIKWREDFSNNDLKFLRNRVRHEILPLLSDRLNPKIKEALGRSADIWLEENKWLEELAMKDLAKCVDGDALKVDALLNLCVAARRRVLRLWLLESRERGAGHVRRSLRRREQGVTFDTIARIEKAICAEMGTSVVPLGDGLILRREYGRILLETESQRQKVGSRGALISRRVAVPGKIVLEETGVEIETMIASGIIKDIPKGPGKLPARASLSYNAEDGNEIYVRSRIPGDVMKPFGISGTKKLKDIFIDEKVPENMRDKVPVFECKGEIIWIPGYRVARGWEVREETESVLHLRVDHIE